MKKLIFTITALLFVFTFSKAQTTAMPFAGLDCNGNPVDVIADLDAGKAVILHFYMPSCGSCPPPAQKIQAMADMINAAYPGMVKGFAFPFNNSTTCTYSSNWVSSNGLPFYAPMDSGAAQVAHYGGFGMPTVVVLGGADHRVLFSTLSFSTSDTTIMRDSILRLLNPAAPTGINDLPNSVSSFTVFPNPAKEMVSISIDLKSAADLMIEITDLSGKQIAVITDERQYGSVVKQFNTAGLSNGYYLVRLRADGKTVTQKLSVVH